MTNIDLNALFEAAAPVGWIRAFAGHLQGYVDKMPNVRIRFFLPYWDEETESAAVRTIEGDVSKFERFWNGNSSAVRFEVNGEVFRVRPDCHIFIEIASVS